MIIDCSPKPHLSPRDPARALERVNLYRLCPLPFGAELRLDPAAVGCAAGEPKHVGPRADLVHDVAGLGLHARQQVDPRATDVRVELEPNARRREPSRVPDLVLILRQRVVGDVMRPPRHHPVGRRGCGRRNQLPFFQRRLWLAALAEHLWEGWWLGFLYLEGVLGGVACF